MGKTWFTSDTHFFHSNIIKYCGRPYNNFDEMNNSIIKKWNERIKPEDTVYFLGDFNFKSGSGRGEGEPIKVQEIIRKLNGHIIFIKGNHDGDSNGIKSPIKAMVIELGGMEIFCTHDPADSNNAFKLNLCGHVHEKWKSRIDVKHGMRTVIINCGVDVWDFYPVSLEEILDEYNYVLKNKGLKTYRGK